MLEMQEKMVRTSPNIPEADRQRMLAELKSARERAASLPPEESSVREVPDTEEPPELARRHQTTRDWPLTSDPYLPEPRFRQPWVPDPTESSPGRPAAWMMMPATQVLAQLRTQQRWVVLDDHVAPGDRPILLVEILPLATVALYRLGDAGVKAMLLAQLASPDRLGRLDAIETLGLSRDASVGSTVAALLSDPDLFVRRRAALALGRIGGLVSLEPLKKAARDPEPRVRRASLLALSLLDQPAAPPVPTTTQPVPRYSTWRVRETTAPLSASVAAAIREGLKDADASVRLFAAELLALHGDSSGRAVLEAGPTGQMVYLALASLGDAAALKQLNRYQRPNMKAFQEAFRVQTAESRLAQVQEARETLEDPGKHPEAPGAVTWPTGTVCLGREPRDSALLLKQLDGMLVPWKLGLAGGACDPTYFDKLPIPPAQRKEFESIVANRPATSEATLLSTWAWFLPPGQLLNRIGALLGWLESYDPKLAETRAADLLSEERAPLAMVGALALSRMNSTADPAPLEKWLESPNNSIRLSAAVLLALLGSRAGSEVLSDWVQIHHWPVGAEDRRKLAAVGASGALELLRRQVTRDLDDPLEPPELDQTFHNPSRYWELQDAANAARVLSRLNPQAGLAWARQYCRRAPDNRAYCGASVLAGDNLGPEADALRHELLEKSGPKALERFCRNVSPERARSMAGSLAALMERGTDAARFEVELALGRANDPRAVERLKKRFSSSSAEEQARIARLLVPHKHETGLELLRDLADEGEGEERLRAAILLAAAGRPDGAGLVERLLPSTITSGSDLSDNALRLLNAAFQNYGYVPPAKVADAARACLRDSTRAVRRVAIALLAKLPQGLSVRELGDLYQADGEPELVSAAYLVELACKGAASYQDPHGE
jgi:HEAT repeat protein